jgi:hypothetical protein
MKTIVFGIAILAAVFTACTGNNNPSKEDNAKSADTTQTNVQPADTAVPKTASVNAVVTAYLQLKNALANDNGNDAAAAAKGISSAMQTVDAASFTGNQKKVFDNIKDDINEHADHISTNGNKIAHQREHFDMLSKDMYDLVKAVGSGQTLYQDHCPMYNDGKGATWLSEVKEIKNPYLGKKMPDCGTVKEEIKQ